MMHTNRRWVVSPVVSTEELARMLTERAWTLCSGFYVEGHPYLFLNDATHEDGAGEFGIVKTVESSEWLQVESITFSWCSLADAERHIKAALAGEFDVNDFARKVDLKGCLDTPAEHQRCHLCA